MRTARPAPPVEAAAAGQAVAPPGQPDTAAAAPPSASAAELGLESLYHCKSQRETFRRGLELVASHFEAGYATLRADLADGTVEDHVEVNASARRAWRKICEGLLLNARYKRHTAARFYQADGYQGRLAVLAAPLKIGSQGIVGAVAVVIPCPHPEAAQARLKELTALLTVIAAAAAGCHKGQRDAEDNSAAVSAGLAKGGNQSLQEFAFSLANGLKSKLGCDQVALGLVRGRGIKLMCISGFDELYPRSPGSRAVMQAMCECLDAEDFICFQREHETTREIVSTGHRLHGEWHASVGNQPVASIPLVVRGATVAVVSLRNPVGQNFTRANWKRCRRSSSHWPPT